MIPLPCSRDPGRTGTSHLSEDTDVAPAQRTAKARYHYIYFRGPIASLQDSLSTLHRGRHLPQRKTRFQVLAKLS